MRGAIGVPQLIQVIFLDLFKIHSSIHFDIRARFQMMHELVLLSYLC